MNINESKFRQIIREEARRALREQVETTTPSPEPIAAAPRSADVWTRASAQFSVVLNDPGWNNPQLAPAKAIVEKARSGWLGCKDPASSKSKEVYGSLLEYADYGLHGQLAAALLSLSDTQPGTLNPPFGAFTVGPGPTAGEAFTAILKEQASKTLVLLMMRHFTPPVTPVADPAGAASTDLIYTVKSGDSLSKILKTYYGIPATPASLPLYKGFANIANIKNMNVITMGQRITLPQTLTIGTQVFTRKA